MNPNCPRCGAAGSVCHGSFRRHEDAQKIPRFRCKSCGKTHSSATHVDTYQQKRRRLNPLIEIDIVCGMSQRRIAMRHGCDRKTVARKLKFLAEKARRQTTNWLADQEAFDSLQWDELITFEHSRLKPLSVAVMCCTQSRRIVAFGVAEIPASGKIAKRSVEKYGKRPDKSGPMRRHVLEGIAPYVAVHAVISTDEHKRYAQEIKKALPSATHLQYESKRGSLTAQGELKRTGYDPLFSVNHTLAMMRDNIKRLSRRTWCTTKRADVLDDIIAIYMHFHNTRLVT